MSRSLKKNPVHKDPSNSKGKKIANRVLRRKVKEAMHHENDAMPKLKEVYNTYNLVDFKETQFENPKSKEAKKLKRK